MLTHAALQYAANILQVINIQSDLWKLMTITLLICDEGCKNSGLLSHK